MIGFNRASYTDAEIAAIFNMAYRLVESGHSIKETAQLVANQFHRTTTAIRQQLYLMGISKQIKAQKINSKLVKYAEYKTKEGEEYVVFKKVYCQTKGK